MIGKRDYVHWIRTTSLHTHVVYRRRHSHRPYGSRIPTRDGDNDLVDVECGHQQRAEGPFRPRAGLGGNLLQGDEDGQRPDLAGQADEEALVRLLGRPGPEEQLQDEEHVGGNGQQIRLEGTEADGFELQGQVLRDGFVGYEPGKTENVNGPHVIVPEGGPERRGRQRLPVVHIAFARVVADDAIDHDVPRVR